MIPVLHGYFRSSSAWRVRLALHLKGIEFETRAVNLLRGEQLSPEYGRVSPLHAVPALEMDGRTFVESMAILEYLEETRPEPALLPKSPADRALARAMAQLVVADIQPVQNLRVLKKLDEEHAIGQAGRARWARHFIAEGFGAFERMLEGSNGRVCVGEAVSFADVCLVPQVYNARRFELDLTPYPTIVRIDEALRSHPAFELAHPSKQPDCPAELR